MLYMTGTNDKTGGELSIIVLSAENLDEIRKGRPAKTPDGKILVAFTADMEWLANRVLLTGGNVGRIGELIDEAAKRPVAPTPPDPLQTMKRFFLDDKQ